MGTILVSVHKLNYKEVIEKIKKENPDSKIIVFVSNDDDAKESIKNFIMAKD